MGFERLRLPLALVAAVLVAELAVVALGPHGGVIAPVPVSAPSYFSGEELQQARDFRRPQLMLYVGTLVIELVALAALAARPPGSLRRARRPVLAAGLTGAALAVALDLVTLPVRAVMRERALDVGLVTRSWAGWASDVALTAAITAVFAGLGAMAAMALVRRAPRRWWVPGAAVIVGYGVLSIYLTPIVTDPLFNRFTEVRGPLRAEVLELARRADVEVGRVQIMDASRRTTAANAYVAGIGSTKRVVIYDNLIDDFPPEEVRLVVAHELAHQHYRDLPTGLLYLALVAPLGMFAAAQLTRRLAPAPGADGRAGPEILPALAFSVVLVALAITVVSNQMSREVEARADSYALRLTDDPDAFIAFERRIARQNISDPDPHPLSTFLLGTHPSTIDRIGIGEAYRRRAR